MKKYLQPDKKITFCRVDKKGSVQHLKMTVRKILMQMAKNWLEMVEKWLLIIGSANKDLRLF